MEFNNKENKMYTTTCGKEIWNSRSVAVVSMVLMRHMDEIYVIMGKRGSACPDEVGKWSMPCGYLDWNETCEEAAVRETWEESGFNCYMAEKDYEVLFDQMYFPWKKSDEPYGSQNVTLHYALYLDSRFISLEGETRLPDLTNEHNAVEGEVDEVMWIKVSDIRDYDVAFNHDSAINVFVSNLPGTKWED